MIDPLNDRAHSHLPPRTINQFVPSQANQSYRTTPTQAEQINKSSLVQYHARIEPSKKGVPVIVLLISRSILVINCMSPHLQP